MTDADLNFRLNILETSGQISRRSRALTEDLISQIEEEFGLKLGEGNAAPLVTHIAKALERLIRGEEISFELHSIGDELLDFPEQVSFSRRFFENLGIDLQMKIPPAEVSFLAAHLSVMTMQR